MCVNACIHSCNQNKQVLEVEVMRKPQGGWECVLGGLWHFFGVPWEMLELSSRSSLGCPMKDSLDHI